MVCETEMFSFMHSGAKPLETVFPLLNIVGPVTFSPPCMDETSLHPNKIRTRKLQKTTRLLEQITGDYDIKIWRMKTKRMACRGEGVAKTYTNMSSVGEPNRDIHRQREKEREGESKRMNLIA
jgi:hypothetical protein